MYNEHINGFYSKVESTKHEKTFEKKFQFSRFLPFPFFPQVRLWSHVKFRSDKMSSLPPPLSQTSIKRAQGWIQVTSNWVVSAPGTLAIHRSLCPIAHHHLGIRDLQDIFKNVPQMGNLLVGGHAAQYVANLGNFGCSCRSHSTKHRMSYQLNFQIPEIKSKFQNF